MAVPAIFSLCIFNILPALLLVFYPIKVFRKCLSRCKLDSLSLAAFTEKFHCCYRDGLDGGRDMRSFAGFYFLLRYLPYLFYILQMQYCPAFTLKSYLVLIYLSSSLLFALVRPYKATYMNVLDSLLLALAAFTCVVLLSMSAKYYHQLFILFCIPTFAFGLILFSRVLIKLYRWLSSMIKAEIPCKNYSHNESDLDDQPLLPGFNSHN